MTTTVKVEYCIDLVGTIWMPPVKASTRRRYERERTFATWSEQPDWNNPVEELEAIEQNLMTDTGDFQSVDDWLCEKVVTKRWIENNEVVQYIRSEIIRDWSSEENRELFFRTLYQF